MDDFSIKYSINGVYKLAFFFLAGVYGAATGNFVLYSATPFSMASFKKPNELVASAFNKAKAFCAKGKASV